MRTLGRYEVGAELGSRGPFAVYAAKRDGQAAFAVKVYSADPLTEPEDFERLAGEFLEGAAAQKALVEAGATRWAAIHESGRDESSAWYATDLYAMSSQKLADGRRALTPRDIGWLVCEAARALAELRDKAGGRAFGELRPSNVLISSKDQVQGSKIVLTDLPSLGRVRREAARDDFTGLANLLHQLVVHRPAPSAGAVAKSPEWSALGPAGEALRQECEKLVNVSGAAPTFEEVIERIDLASRKKPAASKGMIAGVAAAVVLLGGAGAAVVFKDKLFPGQVEKVPDPVYETAKLPPPSELASVDEAYAALRTTVLSDDYRQPFADAGTDDVLNEALREIEDKQREALGLGAELTALTDSLREVNTKDKAAVDAFNAKVAEFSAKLAAAKEGESTLKAKYDARRAEALETKRKQDAGETDSRGANPATYRQTLVDDVSRLLQDITPVVDGSAQEWRDLNAEREAALKQFEEMRALPSDPAQFASIKTARDEANNRLTKVRDRMREVLREEKENLRREFTTRRDGVLNEVLAGLSDDMRTSVGRILDAYEPTDDRLKSGQLTRAGVMAAMENVGLWKTAVEQRIGGALAAPQGIGVFAGLEDAVRAVVNEAKKPALADAVGEVIAAGAFPDMKDQGKAAEREAALARATQPFRDLNTRAATLLADAAGLIPLIEGAYGYEEAGPGGTMKAAWEKVFALTNQEPRLRPAVEASVKPRVDRVREIEAMRAPADLLAVVGSPQATDDRPAHEVVRAWRVLAALENTPWPATAETLAQAKSLHDGPVVRALSALPVDAGRRASLAGGAAEGLRGMWMAFVTRHAGAVESDWRSAMAWLSAGDASAEKPIAAAAEAGLPRFVSANFARLRLQETAATLSAEAQLSASDARLQAPVRAFVDGYFAGAGPDAQRVRTLLKALYEGKDVTLETEGPGRDVARQNGMQWQGVPRGESSVTFTGTVNGRSHTLVFVRVGDTESYVCTSEMSVGLFADVVSAANKWDLARELMRGDDAPAGPRTWAWSNNRVAPPPADTVSGGWFAPSADPNITRDIEQKGWRYIPAGVNQPPPSDDSPMNYVSPHGGALVAHLLGCRLPTPEEMETLQQQAGEANANLRDASWQAVFQNRSGASDPLVQNNALWPSGDRVPGPGEELNINGAQDGGKEEGADGTPLFRGVAQGSATPENVIGNVAEWVYPRPGDFARITLEGATGIRGRDRINGPDVMIFGRSALAPSTMPVRMDATNNAGRLLRGYSDVGFRLAFTMGEGGGGGGATGNAARRLANLLGKEQFLTAASRLD